MVFGGLYAATRAKYRTVYGLHEHATLLAGQIELTEENSGKKRRVSYGHAAGDTQPVRDTDGRA